MFVFLIYRHFWIFLLFFTWKLSRFFLDMEQNRKIYQNLVLSPEYVAVIFETLKSASTLLQVSSITYPLHIHSIVLIVFRKFRYPFLITISCEYHTTFLLMFQCPISVPFIHSSNCLWFVLQQNNKYKIFLGFHTTIRHFI